MALKGSAELRARMKAISTTFKPAGREWADKTADLGKVMVPVRTGRLRGSIKRKNATQKRATVSAHYTAFFVDAGTKRHEIVPKRSSGLVFAAGGRTVFAKKVDHPGSRPQPFRQRAAEEGLRRTPLAAHMIKLWNSSRPAR